MITCTAPGFVPEGALRSVRHKHLVLLVTHATNRYTIIMHQRNQTNVWKDCESLIKKTNYFLMSFVCFYVYTQTLKVDRIAKNKLIHPRLVNGPQCEARTRPEIYF